MSDTEDAPDRYAVVPQRLKHHDQWICWTRGNRDGKTTKKPINPTNGQFASTTNPDTWTDFQTAVDSVSNGDLAGIGFVFTDDDPFVGVDLDDCRDPESGDPTDRADRIIETLDSYTEVSPSGTGYHVIAAGELPAGRNRHGSVEMYDTGRFFTMTGRAVPDTPPDVRERRVELASVHDTHVAATTDVSSETPPETPESKQEIDDTELVERAKAAENGAKFTRLWRGNTAGYPSQSEADMALCCLLAFWTGRDRARMDRLFRSSGLMRPKWDEQHFADGSTYGEKTIARAVAVTDDVYDPDAGTAPESTDGPTLPTPGSSESAQTEQADTSADALDKPPRQLRKENRLLRERLQELAGIIDDQETKIQALRAEAHAENTENTESPGQPTPEQAPDDQQSSQPQTQSTSDTTDPDATGLLGTLRSLL